MRDADSGVTVKGQYDVVAGTLADMYAAVTAAIAALSGPLHGGANTNVMKTLLEKEVDIDTKDKTGGTLLIYVISNGAENVVKLLLTRSAKVEFCFSLQVSEITCYD